MNCTSAVVTHFQERRAEPAVWTLRHGRASFGDLHALATSAQALARAEGLGIGDAVLVLARPDPVLYGAILGLLGRGIVVLFVEPWLPVADIEHVLERVKPRAFLGSRSAQLWALRVPAVRRIPTWIHIGAIRRQPRRADFESVDLDPASAATITFSSGTTGVPKGIVRSHTCMHALHDALTDPERFSHFEGPGLCVFPNMVLLHLATGSGALLVPKTWSPRVLARVARVAAQLKTASLIAGPAFLLHLLRHTDGEKDFRDLRAITVGGAQTDSWILERCFDRWPDARWTHLYGGSEAEPVSSADAREAVARSRRRDYFQTLFVGSPASVVEARPEPDGLRVRGPNVATRLESPAAGGPTLERPHDWHNMGDRIVSDGEGWWYAGRVTQPEEEFQLEQRLYSRLQTSACFVSRAAGDRLMLFGEHIRDRVATVDDFGSVFPEIDGVEDVAIVRDRRHRARIDRGRTLAAYRGGRA